MVIYRCDVCDKLTDNDVFPSDWSVLQVNGPQGAEPGAQIRHLCSDHILEKLIEASKA